jgi:pimeloyl-ACP methyl ester carboxylesterase
MKQVLELATGPVAYSAQGEGPPVIVLHRDVVSPGESPFLAALAQHYEVYAIDLPGFGASPRPTWLRNVTQLATLTLHGIKTLDLPPCPLIGLGFGGWVAADIATQDNSLVSELVLVSPWGVKPTNGEIADFVLYSLEEWASLGFHDPSNYVTYCGDGIEPDVLRKWDDARETVSAVAWKPIGHSRQLAAMLRLISVPTQVVWGSDDAIVPPGCARDWATAMPTATTVVINEAGHQVDLEAPVRLSEIVHGFINSNQTLEVK